MFHALRSRSSGWELPAAVWWLCTGKLYQDSGEWQEDPCMNCTCVAGMKKCQAHMCVLRCDHARYVPDECCLLCDGKACLNSVRLTGSCRKWDTFHQTWSVGWLPLIQSLCISLCKGACLVRPCHITCLDSVIFGHIWSYQLASPQKEFYLQQMVIIPVLFIMWHTFITVCLNLCWRLVCNQAIWECPLYSDISGDNSSTVSCAEQLLSAMCARLSEGRWQLLHLPVSSR
jgi:hypothetical protein